MFYKCKMCGGDLEISGQEKTATCPFCGTNQTLPSTDEEKTVQLYNRATYLLSKNEYDRASGIYERIILDQERQAEAYWGLCLCKYGVEYVDDPKTGKKILTCHRTIVDSILNDSDYLKALENADSVSKKIYEAEAQYIDNVQKKILEIANSESPYDIFICYKETDEMGRRTADSVLAEQIYDALADRGYKVFFSKISLEDKIGQEYEPYIFSALASSRIMLVIGTKKEYFDAPWVKNEWARFLKLSSGAKNKYLIPCYKGISPYDMPEEFVNLQAQDVGKLGYLQDLTKGIDKLFEITIHKQTDKWEQKNEDDLIHSTFKELRHMLLFVKDPSHFDEKEFNDKWSVLFALEDPSSIEDYDPKHSPLASSCNFLYVNKLPSFQYSTPEKAFDDMRDIEDIDFQKLEKNEPELCREIQSFLKLYAPHKEYLEKLQKYEEAFAFKKEASKPKEFLELSQMFRDLGDFKDSKRQAKFYQTKADSILNDSLTELIYEKLIARISRFNTKAEKEAIFKGFQEIAGYKNVDDYIRSFEENDPAKLEKKIRDLEEKKQTLISCNTEIIEIKDFIRGLKEKLEEEIKKSNVEFEKEELLLEEKSKDLRSKYNDTVRRLSKCGIFAIGEKKVLREQLSLLENRISNLKRENRNKINDLRNRLDRETEENKKICKETILSYEKKIQEIIAASSEIKTIDEALASTRKELAAVRSDKEELLSLSRLWNPNNVSGEYDYCGHKILRFKLGKYPQSKVMTPKLIDELNETKPDAKNVYHLKGLEFFKVENEFYFIEPLFWKFVKFSRRDGTCFYLMTSRDVLEAKGPMNPGNVVQATNENGQIQFVTKDGFHPVWMYKYSDIRKWLTDEFYSFAFNENEQKVICTAHLDNSASSTSDEATAFYSDDTEDKVFLLSYRAAIKTPIGNESFFKSGASQGKEYILREGEPWVEKANEFVDQVLIPSLGLNASDVLFDPYKLEGHLYEDTCGLISSDYYSDYFLRLTKAKGWTDFQSGRSLLRSPDAGVSTGYNICYMGEADPHGNQFQNGKFDVINDIIPCVILCLSGNEGVVYPDEEFDF